MDITMKQLFRQLLWHILSLFFLLIVYISLSEFEVLPTHFIVDPYVQYLLDLLVVGVIVSGPFFGFRLFTMHRVKQAFVMATTLEKQCKIYRRWCLIRQYFLWVGTFFCAMVYYLSEHTNTALYGLLILLLTNLFCVPSAKEFVRLFPTTPSANDVDCSIP